MELSSLPLFVGSLAVLATATVVTLASDGRALQRWLSALLWLEGISILSLGATALLNPFVNDPRHGIASAAIHYGDAPLWAVLAYVAREVAVLALSFVYLVVLSYLDTPLSRWIRRWWAKTIIALALAVSALQPFEDMVNELRGGAATDPGNLYVGGALIGLFALACSIHALVRAPKGSAARRRAAAFALAFGVHDATTIAGFAIYAFSDGGQSWLFPYYPLVIGAGTVAFVALLAYGFLRTQLFDIDLKIKVGIRRGTLAAIFVIAIFIAFQIAQQYLNRAYGVVAGGVVTGVLVFVSPRLNKLADKVSDAALPSVQQTASYLAFKKLEVYKAAVETAHETGGIDARERLKLDKLRGKLALAADDCAAVEADVTNGAASAAATSAA